MEILNEFAEKNPSEQEALSAIAACQAGMGIVGERFDIGEYFVGDLIFAGDLLTNAINILKPVLGKTEAKKVGSIVLGTVYGDLHDIGKNIFKSMAEAAGFEVHDLGIDQPAENFINKVKETNAGIIGMSGLLTLALESMRHITDELKAVGLRDHVKIIIGGNQLLLRFVNT